MWTHRALHPRCDGVVHEFLVRGVPYVAGVEIAEPSPPHPEVLSDRDEGRAVLEREAAPVRRRDHASAIPGASQGRGGHARWIRQITEVAGSIARAYRDPIRG